MTLKLHFAEKFHIIPSPRSSIRLAVLAELCVALTTINRLYGIYTVTTTRLLINIMALRSNTKSLFPGI